jgi:tight adherence protein B
MVGVSLDTWLSAALTFIAIALGTLSLALMVESLQERRRQRGLVRQLHGLEAGDKNVAHPGLFRRPAEAQPLWLQRLLARTPALADLELLLQQAGASIGVESFLLTTVGWCAGSGVTVLALTRSPFVAVLAAVAGGSAPYLHMKLKRKRRFSRFEAFLPEAIDLLGRAIRAGHPLSSGFKMVADEMKDPIAGEFRRTFEEQRFGLPFDDAVLAMADRVTLIDVRILVTAILIQREVGGNLAEVLDNLASVIRARFTIRRQLRTYTAQGRISGYVLAVLPIFVASTIYLLNPEYEIMLFRHPIGKLMLMTAIVMQILGYLWIRKIVNIDI